MQDNQNYGEPIRYVVITQSILGDARLNANDKIVLAHIAGFEEFFASNQATGEFLGLSERQVERSKQKLQRLGFIEVIKDTGRGRIYRGTFSWFAKNGEAGSPKLAEQTRQNWRTYKKKENIDDIRKETNKEKTEFGNHEINTLLELWRNEIGIDCRNQQTERNATWTLLRKTSSDELIALIRTLGDARRNHDRFAPQIAKPSDLIGKYGKLDKLRVWASRQERPMKNMMQNGCFATRLPEIVEKTDEERAELTKKIRQAKLEFLRRNEG